VSFLERQLEDPVRFARIKRWFYRCLAAVVVAEIVVLAMLALDRIFPASNLGEKFHVGDPHVLFEWIPAWGSLYGLASCWLIIVVSKFLGKKWLMRREDYYDLLDG